MVCKHGETAIVCGYCDNEILSKIEQKQKARLNKLDQEIAEGDLYDEPSAVMEPLLKERNQIRRALGLL
jgi:hypothetical protein